MRDFRRPRLWLGLWVLGWGLCIALSLLPAVPLPGPEGSDKVGHFLAYFTLTAWAVAIFRTRGAHLLAALSHGSDFSVGCYCEEEAHCHRSVLRELLAERGAAIAAE